MIKINILPKKWLVADQLLGSACAFLINVLFARAFGVEWFGSIMQVYLINIITASLFYSTILKQLLTVHQNLNKKYQHSQLKYKLQTQLLIGLPACLIIYISTEALSKSSNLIFFDPFGASIFIYSFLMIDVFRKILIAQGLYKRLFFVNLTCTTMQLISVCICMENYPGVKTDSVLMVFSLIYLIVSAVIYFFSEFRHEKNSIRRISYFLKNDGLFAKWNLPSALLPLVFGENFLLMIAASIGGPAILGIIKIYQNIMGIFNPIIIYLETTLVIKYSKLYNNLGKKELIRVCINDAMRCAIFPLFAACVSVFFGFEVINIIYDVKIESSNYYLGLYSLGYVIVCGASFFKAGLQVSNKSRYIFFATTAASLFSIISANYFIGNYGEWGFLFGFIGFQSVFMMIMAIFLKNK